MFSFAAINDVDSSRSRLEPLAPTKEAQESRLKEIYEEALLCMQHGQFVTAQTLFLEIIQDQICFKAHVDNAPGSGSMVQLRFLTFKNLAEAYCRQGHVYYKEALECYLEAVSLDGNDVVLWNRLGTLACTLELFSTARKAFEKGLQCSPRNWSCMEKLAEVLIHIGDEKACLSVVHRLLKASPFHPRALQIKKTIEAHSDLGIIKLEKFPSIQPKGIDLLEPEHCSLAFPRKRRLDETEDAGRGLRTSQCQTINIQIEELSWSAIVCSLCQFLRQIDKKDKKTSACQVLSGDGEQGDEGDTTFSRIAINARVCFLINPAVSHLADAQTDRARSAIGKDGIVHENYVPQSSTIASDEAGQTQSTALECELSSNVLEESQILRGSLRETSDGSLFSPEEMDGKVNVSIRREMANDEEPQAGERRSSRLERLRTRRYDKIEDSDNALVKCWQIFKQLLEDYPVPGEELTERSSETLVSREQEHHMMCHSVYGCFIHAGKYCKTGDCIRSLTEMDAVKNEVEEVSTFVKNYSCNSGIWHVGNAVLERVALGTSTQQEALPYLFELERCTRNWEKTRNSLCSLFLAELYMNEAATCNKDSDLKEHLRDCNYHLCKLLEFRATQVASFGIVEHENKQDQKTNLKQHDRPMHWSFWLRFHYVSAHFWMMSGNLQCGYEEFQKCLAIFHAEEQADNPSVMVSLPHCKVDNKISEERIKRLLYEYNLEDLQRHSAATLLEMGQFAELIDLLSPILLTDNDVNMKPFWGVCVMTTSHFSQELSALEMLVSACERVRPLNYKVAFQCYYRRLEIFCRLTGILTSSVTDNLMSPELNVSIYDSERDQMKEKIAMKWHVMIWKELKVIARTAAHIKEKMDETGNLTSSLISAEFLDKVQHLTILVMGHFLSILSSRKSSSVGSSGLEEDIESSCFVDAAVAFCRIQHLQPSATVEQQVSLLTTMHELLAECGLCCAGLNCEGGEGTFLKMAIKHLLALEILLKETSSPLNDQNSACQKSDGNFDRINDTQEEPLVLFAPDLSSQEDLQKEGPQREKLGKTKRKSETSKSFHEKSLQLSLSRNTLECGFVKSSREHKKQAPSVEQEQDANIVQEKSLESRIENALDQNFFCLYGLNLRGGLESNNHEGLALHKNTSRGEFQTKEQCAGVLQYILPYAEICPKSCLIKLRKVLRAVRKQFPKPPARILAENPIDSFLDDEELDEEKFCNLAVSSTQTEALKYALQRNEETSHRVQILQTNHSKDAIIGSSSGQYEAALEQNVDTCLADSSENKNISAETLLTRGMESEENTSDGVDPYTDVYANLYYLLTQVEDVSSSDKWPGFVLTSEGEDFVEQNAKLFKYDLLYNPSRFDSWKRLASIYDEEVDLMLNDGSKNVNVLEWRKNTKFTSRVENSRRRSRRCLLMSLALTSSEVEQSEMHEMLALVYYDTLQNVVPSYDQRQLVPVRDSPWMTTCKNSFRHFKAAFSSKPDWTHLLYMGKLREKMAVGSEEAFSYYEKAIEMNPTVVDPVYRLHRSRLKLLCSSGYEDCKVLQIVARHCFVPSIKDNVSGKLGNIPSYSLSQQPSLDEGSFGQACDLQRPMGSSLLPQQLKESWNLLFKDCMSAMHMCIEGELKHFHKARFSLAQGLHNRALENDLEKAKEELSFCFKSGRSPFIINMWELDGVVKKSKRKTTGNTTGKRILDLGLPESSRKFITCVRKYLLFYLILCEQTADLVTLERAYTSLKIDKKFSLCLDDVASVALGSYIRTLGRNIGRVLADGCIERSSLKGLLEKLFNVFMDHGSSWCETVGLSLAGGSISDPMTISEESIYGYIHTYLHYLEKEGRIEILESVNERLRKRFRNPKLANSHSSLVCKHASLAWCQALCFALSQITPAPCELPPVHQHLHNSDHPAQFLLDLREDKSEKMLYNDEFCQISGDVWNADENELSTRSSSSSFRGLHFVPLKKVSTENLERAAALLKSTYFFYRESSSGPFPNGINLYIKACNVPAESCSDVILSKFSSLGFPSGYEALDISTPRKLLLWAFALVHGRVCSVAEAVKYCEEQVKVKVKKVPAVVQNVEATPNLSIPGPSHEKCVPDLVRVPAIDLKDPASSYDPEGTGVEEVPRSELLGSEAVECYASVLKEFDF